jgi:DNA polymerase-3 subunit beta
MRFTIEKESLMKGLTLVSKAIPPKTELPIFANIKLALTEKGLEITGSDGNISICTIVPFMIGEKEIIRNSQEGSTLVAAKILLEVVRHLDDEICTFELVDTSILKIEDSKSNFKLNSIRSEEYPDIDLSVSGASLTLPGKDIQTLVESTAFAASIKETRPILTAVNLEAGDFKLVATATDTARLARKHIDIESDVRFVANIAAKKLIDIVRSFEEDDEVTIAVNEKKAVFAFANSVISTRLTSGDYPNTKNIFPKVFNYHLEVNAQDFLKAMERVSLLSTEYEGVVKLIMDQDEVEMISRSTMVGSANEKLKVFQFAGEHLEISFKASFVADAIRACRSEDVTIAFVGEMKPFVVKNVKDESIEMLVTPLRS